MEQSDYKQFAALIYGLAEENGGTVSKNGIRLKYEALKQYTMDQVVAAANWIAKNRTESFPPVPKIPEFISAIERLSGVVSEKTTAEIEADKVLYMSKIFGRECNAQAKDPITNYLLKNRWSWWKLGTMKEEDLKWWRRDFVEAYQDMAKNGMDKMIGEDGKLKQLASGLAGAKRLET
jgi:hypothetical protein